jgi:germination protein M
MTRKLISLLLALTAAACSKGATLDAGPPTSGTGETPASSAAPSSTATTTPGTTQVTLYYLAAGAERLYLAAERHLVPRTQSIARAALEELVHGIAQDPDHSTPYPRTSKIISVTVRNKVATVDWSAEVLTANAGAETESLGIQSIVYTLTEFSSITAMRFTVEGKERGTASNGRAIGDFWSHVGLSGQPWDRAPQIEVLAPITLWTPLNGSRSGGTFRVTGEASTFEANVRIVLRDAAGKVVVQTSTTASRGAPQRGPFDKTITFVPRASAQTWTLEVIEDSPEDGSTVYMENRTIGVG